MAGAKRSTVERLGAGAPAVKRWGGHVLLLVGTWFVLLGIWAEAFARIFPV